MRKRNAVPSDFLIKIKSLRSRLGLTQQALADLIGVSVLTVNRWENGQARPRPLAWEKIESLEASDGLRAATVEAEAVAASFEIDFGADPDAVRLVAEAERLSFGHLFNPSFATEISLIDPLPHQRIAVYDRMLMQPRLRLLLADDAGAGKTIMTGLYIREMRARRLIRRVLVVPPAGLVGNWEREMRTLFRLPFRIVSGADSRAGNPFVGEGSDLAIVSIDTLAGERMFGRLQELADTSDAGAAALGYDLVVFDEAHKLSADRDPRRMTLRKTDRYRLAEALAGVRTHDPRWRLDWRPRHLLLLTATPHMGKDYPYYCLWRLLEPDGLPTLETFQALSGDQRARYFVRRTKEEMVRFDGSRIYPTRVSDTLSFDLTSGEDGEQRLYDETTAYIRSYYNRAQTLNRSAARLAMGVFQRRLASSTYALLRSLERRREKIDTLVAQIEEGRVRPEDIAARQQRLDLLSDPFDDHTPDEESPEPGREEHEKTEDDLLGAVVGRTLAELQAEREKVGELIELARRVEGKGDESKFERLCEALQQPDFRNEKVLIFTEHRDTLSMLVRRLEGLGFAGCVAQIHGGMDFREREEQVTFFRKPVVEGGATYLVATDAAGEGINLQFCWLMVNYDVPWNPARLEQRMGRIHRYGQAHDPVVILNLVAAKTREGRVLHTLLDKLDRIRKEMGSDKVFDVVGRVFEALSIKRYMELALTDEGAHEAERELNEHLTAQHVRDIGNREREVYGDGGDVARNLPRLCESMERDDLRRLLPGYVRVFLERAAPRLGLAIHGDLEGEFTFEPLRAGALDPVLAALDSEIGAEPPRFSLYRDAAQIGAVFLHPGEPCFERLRECVLERFSSEAARGGVFLDATIDRPYLFHLLRVSVVRAADASVPGLAAAEPVESRLVGLRQDAAGKIEECPVEHLLLLRSSSQRPAAARPFVASARSNQERARQYAVEQIAGALVAERRAELLAGLAEREAFLRRGFDHEGAELAARRIVATQRAREGDGLAKVELDKIKERQRLLSDERDAAITSLRREPELICAGDISFVAHALVLPATADEDREQHDAAVEAVAMELAAEFERSHGARVRDVSRPDLARAAGLCDWPGFDLLSQRPDGTRRCIEVKGRARGGAVEVKENEWAAACNLRGDYWLYAAFECATPEPRLLRVQDPFSSLLVKAHGGVLVSAREIRAASLAS